MACCIVTLNDVVSLKLLKKQTYLQLFYRIKKEEEENHRNKKEITTKFDEEPFFNFIEEDYALKIRVTTVSHKTKFTSVSSVSSVVKTVQE